jgi:hypothetical protein
MGIQGGSTPRIAVRTADSLRSPDTSIYPAGEQLDVTIQQSKSFPRDGLLVSAGAANNL